MRARVEVLLVRPPEDIWLVRKALLRAGFRDRRFLQSWKPGQVWGLSAPVSRDWQLHVRGFEDGLICCELEPSARYVEHRGAQVPASALLLAPALEPYGFRLEVAEAEVEVPDGWPPRKLHDWGLLALGAGLGAGAVLGATYFMMRRFFSSS